MKRTKHTYRSSLPERPGVMRHLPLDRRGYPVPFFVAFVDGEPDHRIVEPIKLARCISRGSCWLCGAPLTSPCVCVVGPMCGVNRISAEPPSHEVCARYAVQACPFLSRPNARRRDAGLPDEVREPAGVMLQRNPGVSLLWHTAQVRASRHGRGWLFDIGEPLRVEWWVEGRPATRLEALESVHAGLPALEAYAGGPDELAEIHAARERLLEWLPA